MLGPGEEVDDVYDALLMDVPGLEDVGRGQILLLGGAAQVPVRVYAEVASLVLVKELAEDGGRVEVRPTGAMLARVLG
jgi:hypothetical protein